MTALGIDIRAKNFPGQDMSPPRRVLGAISIHIPSGEFVCILGRSGIGKTTLLNIVAGLDKDFDGAISHHRGTPRHKPRIGYVFQNPVLLPWRNVRRNIELVMTPRQIAGDEARTLLDAMGLAGYGDTYPKGLSLGMARRVALARALAVKPDLLLMDEPFVSLDDATVKSLHRLLLDMWHAKPTTVLFVTHNSHEAATLGSRIIVIDGAPATVVLDKVVPGDLGQGRDEDTIATFRGELEAAIAARPNGG